MRLSQLFGDRRIEDNTRGVRQSPSATADINRQIRSLVPGQTIHGEVLSRNGSDVQIRLSEDMVLQAKVDRNMNLEVGKNMTFEVRNNGSSLTLSPLFENVSSDINVMKALDMAGLPVNETSVAMTGQMMEAGLPVDRNTLQQVFREINAFPQAEVTDVVNLHKLGLPVNQENVDQMISYRNLTHQLLGGMDTVLQALPEAMEGMLAEGDLQGLSGLYQELFELVQEGAGEIPAALPEMPSAPLEAEPETAAGLPVTSEADGLSAGNLPVQEADIRVGQTPAQAAEILLNASDDGGEAKILPGQEPSPGTADGQIISGTQTQATDLSANARTVISGQLLSVLSQLPLSDGEAAQFTAQLRQFAQGELGTEQLFALAGKLMASARTAEDGVQTLHRIFSGKEFRELMSEQLKELWTIKPEELAEEGKVDDLYRRLDRQLKTLTQALESGGQAQSTACRTAVAMSQNIDFLNQLNQMYAYIQLPLHLRDGEAHGDLYVYANKKSLAENEGKISALLHLDMEHLGPVDVYVTLEQSRVNTKFYVRDDEMLDFLEAHMDILTERLAKRGYDCSFSMIAREEGAEEENSGLAPILRQEKGMLLSQYAFDVRT